MRWAAAIIGGGLVGFLLYFLVSMVTIEPQMWVFLVGWLGFGLWYARSREFAWARVWLTLCIIFFALPLVVLIFSGQIGAAAVGEATDEFEAAGAAIGSALGGAVLTGFATFAGFFGGIIFAIVAYFSHQSARDRVRKRTALPVKISEV